MRKRKGVGGRVLGVRQGLQPPTLTVTQRPPIAVFFVGFLSLGRDVASPVLLPVA